MASRWWWFLAIALLLAVSVTISVLAGGDTDLALQELPIFGWFCYRAGRLKSEWERTQGAGYFEQHRPPGL